MITTSYGYEGKEKKQMFRESRGDEFIRRVLFRSCVSNRKSRKALQRKEKRGPALSLPIRYNPVNPVFLSKGKGKRGGACSGAGSAG